MAISYGALHAAIASGRVRTRNRRWREDREISVAARESIEADLAVSYGCKLTAQKAWQGTMLGRRPVGVDNADTRARLKRGNEIVEQAVGLGDLVIHVYQNCNVERIGWQPWIVRLAEADYNVLQSEVAHPTAQAPQIFGYDIFCDDASHRRSLQRDNQRTSFRDISSSGRSKLFHTGCVSTLSSTLGSPS